jgi:hypothetical protein
MRNILFQLMAGASLMSPPSDFPTDNLIPSNGKGGSKRIQLSRKVYKHRQKRMKMQKESRKLNRA